MKDKQDYSRQMRVGGREQGRDRVPMKRQRVQLSAVALFVVAVY